MANHKYPLDKNSISSVDIFIDEEVTSERSFTKDPSDGKADKKSVVKSLLKIPYKHVNEGKKAFRVFDSQNDVLIYASTSLGNLEKTDSGFVVDVTNRGDLIGKRFELAAAGSKELLLQGKITIKKAESKIVVQNTGRGTENLNG